MFSGIVEAIGKIKTIENCNGDKQFSVDTDQFAISDIKTGDSIAINGVCLTLVEHYKQGFITDVSNETLACTTFAELKVGSKVNLEKALRSDSRLNGHMVTGHVDGVGTIQQRIKDGRSERFVIDIPEALSRYICKKGSVCVNGVSLTVNDTNISSFAVNIIPHTLESTILADLVQGDRVNIEVDIIARYLEALHASYK